MDVELITYPELKALPARQRVDVTTSHILALAESISQNGLLHAPIVNEQLELIAGDCRRRAIKVLFDRKERISYNGELLPLEYLPVVKTIFTTEKDLFRIELEENLRRKNLSQIEEAQAIARLHELNGANDPQWTNKQTAEQLADFRGKASTAATESEVAQALLLAQFANNPEVRGAKTKLSAVKIAKRLMEIEFRSSLGIETVGKSTDEYQVLLGNALELLLTIPSDSFDGIISDPPYGINADEFGGAAFLGSVHRYKDGRDYALDCARVLAKEGYRICAQEAHIYYFCDIGMFYPLTEIFTEYKWNVWKTPLIWFKGATGHSPRPDYGPKRSYETILFAAKGDKRILRMGTDVISTPSVLGGDKIHAAEKPGELLEVFLDWSFLAGSRILDPFCGSGSIFPAAKKKGITAVGIEIDEQTAGLAKDRISRL